MANHLEWLRHRLNGAPVRAAGEGMSFAVVLTDTELLTGRVGLFARWGNKLERYLLDRLIEVRTVPNPAANVLMLEFGGEPPKSLTVMYYQRAYDDFERIRALLQQLAQQNARRSE